MQKSIYNSADFVKNTVDKLTHRSAELIFALIVASVFILYSCTPVADVNADRTRTVVDSITLDSLYRLHLVISPHNLAFETEYPSQEIIKNIDCSNNSDSLFIPISSVTLANGNNGFSLLSNDLQFVIPPNGQIKSIPVSFIPSSEGIFRDTLIINSWKSIVIPLTAIVNAGTKVWIEDVNFGSMLFGESHDTLVKIYNYGTEPAIVSGATFTSGEVGQFELSKYTRFPITINPGRYSFLSVRLLSQEFGSSITAQLTTTIAYTGQGRVKNISNCSASMAYVNKVYVTDIRAWDAKNGKPYEALSNIVNFTDKDCFVEAFSTIADNSYCTVVIEGTNGGYWLKPKTMMTYKMKITPKKSGRFSISIPFPISSTTDPDSVANINGYAF